MDCRLAMAMLMAPNSVDSIVCDPPYGLSKEPDMAEVLTHWLNGDDYEHGGSGFMGKSWDSFVPGPSVWREAYRVLKPGGHLIAFFGTRTYDLGVLALRLAGFEVRDQLAWVFGSGFPKSHDVSKGIDKAAGAERKIVATAGRSKVGGGDICTTGMAGGEYFETAPATEAARQWQGWGTALKPAYEPIVLCRKPLSEPTVAANVLRWGTGALNIDGCRVEAEARSQPSAGKYEGLTGGSAFSIRARPKREETQGRWPANLAHDGSDEVLAGFPVAKASKRSTITSKPGAIYGAGAGLPAHTGEYGYDEPEGSAARFFKSADYGDEDWLAQNLPHVLASIADDRLSLRNLFAAFARSPAATLALPDWGASTISTTDLPSINVTLSESKSVCEMLTQAILFSESAFSQESPPTKLSLSLSHAQFVADLAPTGITLTMTDLWISSGFVDPIIFNITPTNLGLGARDSAQSTARFKYCAKASKSDRNEGLDDLPERASAASEFRPNHTEGAAAGEDGNPYGRWSPVRNFHPTVKPSPLLQWLVRMVTPPGGTVLDPFMGSGTTGVACAREGFSFVGCEMTPEYAEIARLRIDHAVRNR